MKVPEGLRKPTNFPPSAPSKHGDRFIPARTTANWSIRFHNKSQNPNRSLGLACLAHSALLQNELLGSAIDKVQDTPAPYNRQLQPSTRERRSLFNYSLSTKRSSSSYSLAPISINSHTLLQSLRPTTRRTIKQIGGILTGHKMQDDFYLSLLDWSPLNVVSVGLATAVGLLNFDTKRTTLLCDLAAERDSVTSVGWSERGNLLALGTLKGYIQIWDVESEQKLLSLGGHRARVGVLAWNADQLSSGSRDCTIQQRDIRTPSHQSERSLQGHRMEVCGLKWNTTHQLLASGDNANKLLVWDNASQNPVQTYTEHTGAVKAIAWSPHQHGLLASGGGKYDQSIQFLDTSTGLIRQRVVTGSQVCNLAWSKHTNELVSTGRGIEVWKYPETTVNSLNGVTRVATVMVPGLQRVTHMAMSPDGQEIVTGNGRNVLSDTEDNILRFWKIFCKTTRKESMSVLNLYNRIR